MYAAAAVVDGLNQATCVVVAVAGATGLVRLALSVHSAHSRWTGGVAKDVLMYKLTHAHRCPSIRVLEFLRKEMSFQRLKNFCFAAIALAAWLPAFAQQTPAKKLAQLLASDHCSLASIDRHLWRAAVASDYSGSEWAAWMRVTKSQTPWLATGDFDGDGVEDRAVVIINETESLWRMGVVFGTSADTPCRSKQVSQGSLVKDARSMIAGVLTFPSKLKTMVCHQVAERGKATCKLETAGAALASATDAVLTFDSVPTYVTAYVLRGIARGSPLAGPNMKFLPPDAAREDGVWTFVGQKVVPEMDIDSMK
jgi:hypothetical protein